MRDLHKVSYERLNHIEDALKAIDNYMSGQSFDSFCQNNLLQDAVLIKILIIGEAVINVEKALLEKYEYPWQELKEFRNLIAHEYYNINVQALWLIIRNDLPKLKEIVKKMLRQDFS